MLSICYCIDVMYHLDYFKMRLLVACIRQKIKELELES